MPLPQREGEEVTLTEQAKASPYGRELYEQVSDEHLDLFISWIRGDVATRQVSDVLDSSGNTPAVYKMAVGIRQAIKAGRVKIERVKK
jgi:hypothetical protein